MRRALLAGAVLASSALAAAPAAALKCPPGTVARPLPTGQNVCVPHVHCDPGGCRLPVEVQCPTDVPVWSGTCREVFGG